MYFQNFQNFCFVRGNFLKIRSSIDLSWGHVRSEKKFGPDRFGRFDVYWIQTNKHPDRHAKYTFRFYIYLFSLLKRLNTYFQLTLIKQFVTKLHLNVVANKKCTRYIFNILIQKLIIFYCGRK